MLSPRFLLFGVLLLKFSYEAYAMDCSVGGIIISCPTALNKDDAYFCCKSSISSNLEVCCDAEDYFKQNTGMIVGILVGALILLIITTLCCCCFCSCCLLAKRRTHRGTVLYGQVSSVPPHSSSALPSYPVVHMPQPSQMPPPPPYYQPMDPNFGYSHQPPANPNYK